MAWQKNINEGGRNSIYLHDKHHVSASGSIYIELAVKKRWKSALGRYIFQPQIKNLFLRLRCHIKAVKILFLMLQMFCLENDLSLTCVAVYKVKMFLPCCKMP